MKWAAAVVVIAAGGGNPAPRPEVVTWPSPCQKRSAPVTAALSEEILDMTGRKVLGLSG